MADPPAEPAILYQTNHAMIIDKPAGLPVHAGPAGGVSVEDFFPRWRRGHDGPWLVHRLDADTAGCLLIARRKTFLIEAQRLFAAGQVEKIYWALVHGVPALPGGVIDVPLAKQNDKTGWRMVPLKAGQKAVTEWQVIGQSATHSLLELRPRTGRTHQVRAHCAWLGHPILGDSIYGRGDGKLQLLARSINLPMTPPVGASAELPAAMRAALLVGKINIPA